MSSGKWWPFCVGLNVLINFGQALYFPSVPLASIREIVRFVLQIFFITEMKSGGRLNKKDGLTRYGDSHVKDKTS